MQQLVPVTGKGMFVKYKKNKHWYEKQAIRIIIATGHQYSFEKPVTIAIFDHPYRKILQNDNPLQTTDTICLHFIA
ncbi:hypothetical protein [Pseudoflavitalea rhizosphaerae]|uniref:hypothetical protein n=1 Tax=Pseudoflavitalea rhizosphaerae TaxID=1884793 RepID=UPI000F8EDA34|nr:hypothetical protein [Pseudoflavitalea rhizosphaerae]